MKNIFISILILAAPVLVHTQPYKQCLDGEFIRWSHIDRQGADITFTSSDVIAYGDTLFNNIRYTQLYYESYFGTADSTNMYWRNYIPNPFYYRLTDFYIRESEDFSQLYLYDVQIDEECLISDMNLQVGDSILIFPMSFSVYAIVDSIYFDNELKHINLHYFTKHMDRAQTLTFIEGVGPDQWFIYPVPYLNSPSGSFGVNCFQNQSFFYKKNWGKIADWINFADMPCGAWLIMDGGIQAVCESNYHVFIQPGSMDIIFDSETNADISIYDMQGRLCYAKDNVFDKKIIVPTMGFSNGVYVLRVVNRNNKQTSTTKFIPQF